MSIVEKLELKILSKHDDILVSFSGGPDSVFLVLNLIKLGFTKINCVYFNHQLRTSDELDAETKFIQNFCQTNKLPLTIRKIPIKLDSKRTYEDKARYWRYRLLTHIANIRAIKQVVTGHHKDDHLETALLQLLRGTGSGFNGIRSFVHLDSRVKLIRPLIDITKKEIYEWLTYNNAEFSFDTSNSNLDIKRNLLRNKVLPNLSQINEGYHQNILNFVDYFSETKKFIQNYINAIQLNEKHNKFCLKFSIDLIKQESPFIQKEIIYKILNNDLKSIVLTKKMYEKKHIELIMNVIDDKIDAIDIPNSIRVIRSGEFLVFFPIYILETRKFNYQFNYNQVLTIKELGLSVKTSLLDYSQYLDLPEAGRHAALDYDLVCQYTNLCVRNMASDDIITPKGATNSRRLNRFFINQKIPICDRKWLPMLVSKHNVLCIPGVVTSEYVIVSNKTKKVLLIETNF